MHAKLSKFSRVAIHTAVLSALAAVGGCATEPLRVSTPVRNAPNSILASAERFASHQQFALQPYFKALYIEGEHDAVLNFEYLGLAALESGEYETAAKAFDAAISRIETVYANNPSAQKAKSLFAEEKVKDFKGEPYERAMAYYYRGLLYARAGDYQNARASFLSAEAQSTMSERESFQSTFGLMDYLAGWASHCAGEDSKADELAERASRLQPDPFRSLNARVDFVGLVDVGTGPHKVGTGRYRERLTFESSGEPFSFRVGEVTNARLSSFALAADINWQAKSRGGRPVDAILNGKAVWKGATEDASEGLKDAGFAATEAGSYSGNQAMMEAGEIGFLVGIAGNLFSHTMTPAADTRAWQSLPSGIALVTGEPQGASTPQLKMVVDRSSAPIPTTLNTRVGRCSISWGRVGPGVTASLRFVSNPTPAEGKHERDNRQFRSALESTFASVRTASLSASATNLGEPR
jgi:tetratricopeptide (TPR) repeat protein